MGLLYVINDNMFQWGRRSFTRFCVRIELDRKLPLGVWVEGSLGRFFKKIEYEYILKKKN